MFRYLAVIAIATLALFVVLDIIVPYGYIYAQANQNGQTTVTSNNNMANGTSNSTGIMKNTTGMIDDAFDALKDTFGSFFGK